MDSSFPQRLTEMLMKLGPNKDLEELMLGEVDAYFSAAPLMPRTRWLEALAFVAVFEAVCRSAESTQSQAQSQTQKAA